ncbi:hypothetical protein MK852_13255 [Shewanella benthica]|uniref:hypothetical protein n=1 Tax=Shewanella benthica TaxID=43661 RepID=UPI001D0D2B18|nr:hypothetical protein [Shewanella benthica]MCL1063092.1 hypothetical protein [Shewanella benthica]
MRLKLGWLEFEPDKLTLSLVSLALEMGCETKAKWSSVAKFAGPRLKLTIFDECRLAVLSKPTFGLADVWLTGLTLAGSGVEIGALNIDLDTEPASAEFAEYDIDDALGAS